MTDAARRPDLWAYMAMACGPRPLGDWPKWMKSEVEARFGNKLGFLPGLSKFQFMIIDTEAKPTSNDLEKIVGSLQTMPIHIPDLRPDFPDVEEDLKKLSDGGADEVLCQGALQFYRQWRRKSRARCDLAPEYKRFEEFKFEKDELAYPDMPHDRFPPNVLAAVQISVDPEYRKYGVEDVLIEQLKIAAKSAKLRFAVAAVRPTRKHEYPEVTMKEYLSWSYRAENSKLPKLEKEPGDLPFDPCLYRHHQHGAKTLKICPEAHYQAGSYSDWEKWASIRLTDGDLEQYGTHLIMGEFFKADLPGGTGPLICFPDVDHCEYREANIWVYYDTA